MSTVSCDGPSCCPHDITRGVTRDGVLHSICLCCGLEVDADDMPVLPDVTSVLTEPAIPGTPCGEDVPNRWGGIL